LKSPSLDKGGEVVQLFGGSSNSEGVGNDGCLIKLSDASRDPRFARFQDGDNLVLCVVTEMELANLCLKGARHREFDQGTKETEPAFVTKLRKRWINITQSLVSSFVK
jgi:hypothetical protein